MYFVQQFRFAAVFCDSSNAPFDRTFPFLAIRHSTFGKYAPWKRVDIVDFSEKSFAQLSKSTACAGFSRFGGNYC